MAIALPLEHLWDLPPEHLWDLFVKNHDVISKEQFFAKVYGQEAHIKSNKNLNEVFWAIDEAKEDKEEERPII